MKNLLISCFVILSLNAIAVDKELINALITTESHNRQFVIGDKGKAYGKLQIHKAVIQDVNRIYGTQYRHSDAFNHSKAVSIAGLYLKHYGRAYKRIYGRQPTNEIYARLWNGGFRLVHSEKTDKYWNKVKQHLN